MRKLLFFVFAALVFTACTQDVAVEITSNKNESTDTITVGFDEDDTRIQLNGAQKTVWTEGDLLSVFYLSNGNQKWQYQGETGQRTGVFKRVANAAATHELSKVVLAYPYSTDYHINIGSCNLHATLPATQHYLEGSYGVGDNLMVAQSEFSLFALKNVCGWLKLQLTGNGESVKSITFRGNNNEQVAGLVYVDTATAEVTLSDEMGDIIEDYGNATGGVGGSLIFDDSITTALTLDCGEGVILGDEATAFYIALPPQTFENGFSVEITCADDSKMVKSTDNALTIERNHIQPMKAFEFETEAQDFGFTFENISMEGTACTVDIVPSNESLPYIVMSAKKAYIVDNGFEDDEALFADDLAYFQWLGEWHSMTTLEYMIHQSRIGRDTITVSGCTETFVIYAYYFDSETGERLSDIARYEYEIGNDGSNNDILEGDMPNNEIWYVTADNTPVELSNTDNFGVEFISNTYEDFGVIKFNGDITQIAPYAFYNSNITQVRLPESLIRIGYNAFDICSNLTEITIPNSVTSIEELAFASCTSLQEVHIPENVSFLGEGAFARCNDLKRFTGKYSTEDGRCLIYENTLISFAPVGITSYVIPEHITKIGSEVFNRYEEIEEVVIPAGVTSIGYCAFSECSNLRTVYCKAIVPPTLGTWCFGVLGIGVNAVGRKIYVPMESYEAYVNHIYWIKLADEITPYNFGSGEVELPNIDDNNIIRYTAYNQVFPNHSTALGNVTIIRNEFDPTTGNGAIICSGAIEMLDNWAFSDNHDLITITLPNSVKTFGVWTFAACSNLVEFVVPDSVTELGAYTFDGCTKLSKFTFPANIASKGFGVFDNCISLRELHGGGVTADGRCYVTDDDCLQIFAPAGLTEYTIPDEIKGIGQGAFDISSNLESITFNDNLEWNNARFINHPHLREFKGKNVSADGRCLIINGCLQAFNGNGLEEYIVPDNVTSLGGWSFSIWRDLKRVTLPEGLREIDGAFYWCSGLEELNIPSTTNCIRSQSFEGCEKLTTLVLPEGITEIEHGTFGGCIKLASITLPNSLRTIDANAFGGCTSLTSITFGTNIERVDGNVFGDCTNLASAYFTGLTPPTIYQDTFKNCATNFAIYVPKNVVAEYRSSFENLPYNIYAYDFEKGEVVE